MNKKCQISPTIDPYHHQISEPLKIKVQLHHYYFHYTKDQILEQDKH